MRNLVNTQRTAGRSMTLFALLAMLTVASAVSAQGIEAQSSGLRALPVASDLQLAPADAQYVLSIAGPNGLHLQQEFARGEVPTLNTYYEDGGALPDGKFNYELRIVPEISEKIRIAMKAARESGDQSEIEELKAEGLIPRFAIVNSGSFTVSAGAIVNRSQREHTADPGESLSSADIPVSATDICYVDDLIVDGSLCVGLDCTCNMSFGFDTIVLKENNLRIFFDDTSSSASFPRNDWRITINDSSNGGAEYFGVEDATAGRRVFTLEDGAPAHSLFVDGAGDVGLGTSTPALELEIVDGDSPTVRLQQNGSSGFTPQTWDLAGNETNFFIRDVTNGSTLPFRIRPGAPTSAIDVAADGDVGLSTTSPTAQLHVAGNEVDVLRLTNNGNVKLILEDLGGGASDHKWVLNNANNLRFAADDAATAQMTLTTTGDLTITGNFVSGGGGTCDPGPCDGVFAPDYEVESIEQHADYMWKNQHLWGVGPTVEGAPFNLSTKTTGILHELEKAHIYIEQLHNHIKDLSTSSVEQDRAIEELRERLAALETQKD